MMYKKGLDHAEWMCHIPCRQLVLRSVLSDPIASWQHRSQVAIRPKHTEATFEIGSLRPHSLVV